MSTPNSNWPRWVKASVYSWFTANTGNLLLFFEGQIRKTDDNQSYAEVRIDGPKCTELSKGYWQLCITIDVLVVWKDDTKDLYGKERVLGNVLAAFKSEIPVYQYGDDPTVMVGCFVLEPDSPGIRITEFGQPIPDSRTWQASIEAEYRMEPLTNT